MLPDAPGLHTLAVFGLILVALILFALDRVRIESAALLVFVSLLLVLAVAPYAPPGESFDPASLFEAFGNEALVAVCGLMVLGKGVETTQALRPRVGFVSRNWSRSPRSRVSGRCSRPVALAGATWRRPSTARSSWSSSCASHSETP